MYGFKSENLVIGIMYMYNFDCQIELNVEKIFVFPPKEKRNKMIKASLYVLICGLFSA